MAFGKANYVTKFKKKGGGNPTMVGLCKLSVLHTISENAQCWSGRGFLMWTSALQKPWIAASCWGHEGDVTVSADLYSMGRAIQGQRAPRFLSQSTPIGTLLQKIVSGLSWNVRIRQESLIFPYYYPYIQSPRKRKLEFKQGARAPLGAQFTAPLRSCNTELQNRTRGMANTHWSSSCFS